MNSRFLSTLMLAVCLAATIATWAQDDVESPATAIDERLAKIFFEWDRLDRPGGSVAVIQGGKIVFQQSYGLASLEFAAPCNDRTVYDVVTLAEPFTAQAVAILVAEDELSLDDAVRTHLPELEALGPDLRVRHLVDHTSGLWDWRDIWQLSGGYPADVVTLDHILTLLGKQTAPAFAPGERFDHNATNYTLLAEIVTRVTGEPFRDWLWKKVLRPAHMNRSVVVDKRGESVEGCAQAYDYGVQRGYRRGATNLAAPGAGCLYASAGNMASWLLRLDAAVAGEQELPGGLPEPGKLSGGGDAPYALGLHQDRQRGLERWHTAGQWEGFNAALQYYPEQRFGVIVLSNWVSRWVNPTSSAGQVANLYLAFAFAAAEGASDDTTDDAAQPDPDFEPDPARYDGLAGDYRWDPGENFAMVVDAGRLVYQAGNVKLPLTELSPDRFRMDQYPYDFIFTRDDEDLATSCLIQHAGDADVTAPRIVLADPEAIDRDELTGVYVSPELGTAYSVVQEGDHLYLDHERLDRVWLRPDAVDCFSPSIPRFGMLEFLRDEDGRVMGFAVDTVDLVFNRES